FYIVALVYLIFDVEISLFYPWAVAYGSSPSFEVRQVAVVDMLFFFGVLLVGFAYLWRFGYLDWVRSAATTSLKTTRPTPHPDSPPRPQKRTPRPRRHTPKHQPHTPQPTQIPPNHSQPN